MKIKHLYITAIFLAVGLFSCSRKVHPDETDTPTVVNKDMPVEKKAVLKNKPKEAVPKVISVNDLSAKKTVDGRYYYDLQGHRYWRNNKDKKYYLFNNTMYTDAAFKPE